MSKSIFISTVYEDKQKIDNVKSWAESKRLGDIEITHESEEDKRPLGKQAVKQHLEDKIRKCSAVVVLVGDDTHNHEWIEAEVELAKKFHKPIIPVRLPNTTGGIPEILKNHTEINFKLKSLKKTLDSIH
jgi:hypothetical protein